MKVVAQEKSYRITGSSRLIHKANLFLKLQEGRGLSSHTIRAYGTGLVVFLRWFETEKKRFKAISWRELYEWINDLKSQEIKPTTINHYLTAVQVFYRFCYGQDMKKGAMTLAPSPYFKYLSRKDFIQGAPFLLKKKVKLMKVKVPHPIIEPLTVDQVNQFFASLKKYRDLAITQLMLLCGLRCREILSLKLENVSFEERKIKVMGKGRRERVLPLPELVISTLQRYLRYERPKNCATSIFFVSLQGEQMGSPMTYDGIRSLFRNRRQDFQLRNANPHRWRHTFGANMARERVPLPLLQRMMGHHDPKVTLRYIYLSMADIADEYQRALKKIEERYHV